MQTTIVQINPQHPEVGIIEYAARLLESGELVAFPTETVYGLGADALQVGAVEQIFRAKGRPLSDPLIVHIADEEELAALVTQVPAEVRWLASAFWPGPLTLVLPASERVPRLVTAGLSSVAIRMPRHAVARALIRALGSPIAAPSANRFMHISPTSAQHVDADLHGHIPLILDGGPCEVGVESTVLDVCADVPTVLRPGGVSLEALRTILPMVQLRQPHATTSTHEWKEEAQRSPGQMRVHYAPTVPTLLFEGAAEGVRTAMRSEAWRRVEGGERVGMLVADEDVAAFQDSDVSLYALGSANMLEQVAARLYAGLRTLEESGVQSILCRGFGEEGLGLAIRDRLLKATGGNVVVI